MWVMCFQQNLASSPEYSLNLQGHVVFFKNKIRCTGHRPHKSHVVQQESFVDVAI